MISLSFSCHRCLDGVEVRDFGPQPKSKTVLGEFGVFYKDRTDRVETAPLSSIDLENPASMRFINATTAERACVFLARYGHLDSEAKQTSQLAFVERRESFENLTIQALSGDYGEKSLAINSLISGVKLTPSFDIQGDRARLRFVPRSLFGFMAMEIASATEVGAVLQVCEHCGDRFLTGPNTHRRSSAKYCSERCRLAAMRKRNADAAHQK